LGGGKPLSPYTTLSGSGKTYALVKEYLENYSCKKNDAYRHILPITFTNKAVHEMPVVGSLSEFMKEEPSAKAQDLMQDLLLILNYLLFKSKPNRSLST
jgi:ATP-dependent exoDNAse (exonuclease V) beta subunit